MELRIKRAYEAPARADGRRILVDRLWPRGLSKAVARIDFWARAIAPSNELRRWYEHVPDRWPGFRKRYFAELSGNPEGMEALLANLEAPTVTLVYSSTEKRLNNAAALKEYLESRAKAGSEGPG